MRVPKNKYLTAIVVHLLNPVQLFVTPWTAACQASLSITNSWSLLNSVELVMPSNNLILCCPLLLSSIFSRIRVFSNESAFYIRWPKYWSFSFSIRFQWIQRIDLLVWSCSPKDCQESSTTPQLESINSLVHGFLYGPALTSIHDDWKKKTVEHNKLWEILQQMGIPDHLTCLLRNLYAGQEATVRTGHGTKD